jgi:hypothetical protein
MNYVNLAKICVTLLFLTTASLGDKQIDTEKDAITKLAFMVGKWNGPGWYLKQNNERVEFVDYEKIRLSNDSTMLIMDIDTVYGDGSSPQSQVFVFFFDTKTQKYIFNAFSGAGGPFTLPCQLLEPQKFRCHHSSGKKRFTYTRTDNSMYELGETLVDGKWNSNEETIVKLID